MYSHSYFTKKTAFHRISSGLLAFTLCLSLIVSPVQAQLVSNLPNPGQMLLLSQPFSPVSLRGITINPTNPFLFDFIVDRGDDLLLGSSLESESEKLIKYFLTALTIPDDEGWVNLSPYEDDRIISDSLSVTEMGRTMLEQDYILKQLSASLTNPENELGKKFWDNIYQKANKEFGSTHIPINTFNKVWIVPDKAVVVEEGGSAFTLDWHLKVMMEEDYLALGENLTSKKFGIKFMSENKAKETNKLSSEFVRDIILPELEKEINEGRHFAPMRQVYLSVILATWFKRNLKESLLGKIYMNQGKVAGVDTEDKEIKDKIYQQYLQAFKLGVYYFIKEEADFATQTMIPRRYFSGGIVKIGESTDRALLVKPPSEMTQDELNRVTSGVFAAIRTQLAEPAERKVIEAGRETKEGALMAGKDDIIELVTEALTGNMMLDDIHVIPNVMDIDSPIQLLDMKRFKSFDKKGLIIIDAITISKPKKVIGYYEAEKLISDRYGDIKYFNDSLMHLSSQTLKFVDGSTLLIMLPTIESFMFPILERYALLTTLETLFVETIQKMQLLRLRLASAKPADSAMMANQQKTIELVIKALKDNEMLYEVPAALFFRVKVFEPTIHPLDTQRFKSFNEKGLTIIDATAGISEPKKVIDYDEAEKLIDIRCSDVKYFDDSLLHFASQALEFEDGSTLLIMLPMIWSFILPTIKKFALLSTSQGVMLQLIVKLIRASAIRESAMMAGNKKTRWTRQHNEQTTGGIDFNPRLLDLQIKRDGRGVPLPLPMQDVEHINIEGLYPVIINIAPVNIQTMPFLSRLKEQEERFMHSTS